LAVASSGVVARLMLESPSAGIADPAARATRVAADEELARILDRAGIEAFVERWENLPVFASERAMPDLDRGRLHAARNEKPRPGPGRVTARRGAGSDGAAREPSGRRQVADTGRRRPLDGVGADRAIAIAAAIPAARLMMLEGTGHAPHREAPDRFADLLVGLRRPLGTAPHQRKETDMTTGPKTAWTSVVEYRDIRYEHSGTGIALVTIDRPEVRNGVPA